MGTYVVIHTPIKHGREGKVDIFEPGEDIELTAKEAKRLGDNVRPAKDRGSEAEELEEMTVAKLTAMLEEKGVEVPPKTRKAELIEMVKATEDRGPTTAE